MAYARRWICEANACNDLAAVVVLVLALVAALLLLQVTDIDRWLLGDAMELT